jgi:hypothetical protein
MTKEFVNKESPQITILQERAQDSYFVDIQKDQLMIPITYYMSGIAKNKLFTVAASQVTENKKLNSITKAPLIIKNCDELDMDLTGINFKKGINIDHEECLEFSEPTLIGEDRINKIKKSVWIEVFPCLADCYIHNFGAFGMREIKPSNMPWYS